MIARVWTARASQDNLQRYLAHFSVHVLPELQSCAGFVSAQLFTREENDGHEVVVTTLWASMESIDAFAGPDREAAVVAAPAAALLTSFDRRVRHYVVQPLAKI